MYSDPEGVAVLSREEDRDAFSVGIVIVVLRGWRSSSLPTAINLLPFGQRKYLVAAGSRAVSSVVKIIVLPAHSIEIRYKIRKGTARGPSLSRKLKSSDM